MGRIAQWWKASLLQRQALLVQLLSVSDGANKGLSIIGIGGDVVSSPELVKF